MTDALPTLVRARLGQLLALAESGANPAEGERLAALAAAERLLGQHGLRLRDLPGLAVSGRHLPPAPDPDWSRWRAIVLTCRQEHSRLTAWEAGFLRSLGRCRRLSERQRAALDRIAERLFGSGWEDAA